MLAVEQVAAVVFFVAGFAAFDLAVAGNGFGSPGKLLERMAAHVIKVLRQFVFQPVVKRRVVFDFDFVKQGVVRQPGRWTGFDLRRNPEIHQPAPQVGAVYQFTDGRVVSLRHQYAQAEIMQQAFNGAFPFFFVLFHLQQLPREG